MVEDEGKEPVSHLPSETASPRSPIPLRLEPGLPWGARSVPVTPPPPAQLRSKLPRRGSLSPAGSGWARAAISHVKYGLTCVADVGLHNRAVIGLVEVAVGPSSGFV